MIVMERYQMNVRKWRSHRTHNWNDDLMTYLSIYYQTLMAISSLHHNNITHYDIKSDNILIQLNGSKPKIVLVDFGSSKLFHSSETEFDEQDRGTEFIKSPEMIQLSIKLKKENNNFDRRKKVGTT